MPQRYRMQKPCPTNRNERMRDPMCALPDKPFEPHRRPKQIGPIPPYKPGKIIPTGGGIQRADIPQFPSYKPPQTINVPNYTPLPTLDVGKPQTPQPTDHARPEETAIENKPDPKVLAGRRMKASHEGPLPSEVMESALMVEASYAADSANDAGKNPMDAAETHLETNGLGDWKINRGLSSTHMLMLENGNKVGLSYRGTQPGKVQDWLTNVAHGIGATDLAPQQRALGMLVREDEYVAF